MACSCWKLVLSFLIKMARTYSRKKGKSGSTKPSVKKVPVWVRYKPNEIELLIVKLAKEEKTASQIGIALRDIYGIPDVKSVCKKSISKILSEKKLLPKLPYDLTSVIKKAITVRKHLENNRKDMTAKRGMQLTEAKIGRLTKYYKRKGVLSDEWKYIPEKASFLIE